MQKSRSSNQVWRHLALTVGILAGLAALVWIGPALYRTSRGRAAAAVVEVMRSRAVVYNPGVTGYYERLFGAPHPLLMSKSEYETWTRTAATDVTYDRSFRIRRFRPGLRDLRNSSQPQGLTTNSFGMLGPERSLAKPPGTRRVAVLGDSLAQGWGIDQNRSFVSLLEGGLNASRPAGAGPVEVLNFAVTGYDMTQMLDVDQEDIARFDPDVYVLALTELAVFRNWDEHLAWAIHLGIDLKYDFLRETARESGASAEDAPLPLLGKLAPYRMAVIRSILERMAARAARDHDAFVVFLVPSVEDGDATEMRFAGIRELLASLHIPVVDALDTFAPYPDVERFRINPYDVHPSERGHAMILENLYAKLHAHPNLWSALTGAEAAPKERQTAF